MTRLRDVARTAASEYVAMPRQRVPPHGPKPPAPMIGPTDSPRVDAVTDVINRAVEPFRSAPNPQEGTLGAISHYVGGALGLLGLPFEMMDTGFAMLTAPLAALCPGMPAATLMAPHLGPPHTHTHPPSLIPPAPPVPLPSIGMVMLPGCVSVLHGGIPAARAGDLGMSFTCGTLAPPLDVYTGSSNTFIGGSRAARIFDITRHCNPASASMFGKIMQGVGVAMGLVGAGAKATAGDALAAGMAAAQAAADAAAMALVALLGKDPGLPPGYGALMMGNPLVLIGGFPMPDLMEAIGALFKAITKGVKRLRAAQRNSARMRAFSNRLHQRLNPLLHRLGMSRSSRRAVHRALCFLTGHPVDVATGNVLTDAVDLELPGPLPLKISRDYYSCDLHTGPFGNNWSFCYNLALIADPEGAGVVVRMADGRPLLFPPCDRGQTRFDRRERATLIHDQAGYAVRFADGTLYRFGPATPGAVQPLLQISDRAGHALQFSYDDRGVLAGIVDSSKRVLQIESDGEGRITAIVGPTPEGDGRMVFVRYFYDRRGDLVEVHDALGQPQRYAYRNHLLTQETDRNGLSFYFEYDGDGAHARCVRTWGDGGIYDHRLEYDAEAQVTRVTDSLGAVTTYHVGGDGLVHQIVDALGGTRRFAYNEWSERIVEEDENGGISFRTLDERGNLSKQIGPDGSSVEVAHGPYERPVRAIDRNGGWWCWHYDAHGRLVARDGPDGSRTLWHWHGAYLVGSGTKSAWTAYGYNQQGLLDSIQHPDGATERWSYDQHGRVLVATDPNGNQRRFRRDALGRPRVVREPDGAEFMLEWDPQGNLVRAQDRQGVDEYGYSGMGLLAFHRRGDACVSFEHDSECRMISIQNPVGERYRLEYDALGRLRREIGFDGRETRYERRPDGAVSRVEQASGVIRELDYDAAARLTEQRLSTGETIRYGYRSDGRLIEADNGECRVRFDRDAVGRIVREWQDEVCIEAELDEQGLRRRVCSRLGSQPGAVVELARDVRGRVRSMRCQTPMASWAVHIERDIHGLEIDRQLPGNLRSRWARDPLGRPVQHQVWDGRAVTRDLRYVWTHNRLEGQIDSLTAIRHVYQHDLHGHLIGAERSDGAREWRVADAVGNVYATQGGKDRRYGAGGRLLSRIDVDGALDYQYDAEGNLVRRTSIAGKAWSFEWRGDGQLGAVVRPDGERVEFGYDAFSRRIRKRHAGREIRWIWDGNAIMHELDGEPGGDGEVVTWLFAPGSFAPCARLDRAGASSIVTDHVGTPVEIYDADARRIWAARPDLYGRLHVSGSDDAPECPLRWPGQYADAETGLHYNRARYYSPEDGRYLSQDPIRLRGGLNLYAYVKDPLVAIDPFGLEACNTHFPSRQAALDATYDRLGIPRGTMPDATWEVGNDYSRRGQPGYLFSDDPGSHGRYSQFETEQGSRVIAEHTADPNAPAPHFHAGEPKGDPSRSFVDFGWGGDSKTSERYQQHGGKHHNYYPAPPTDTS